MVPDSVRRRVDVPKRHLVQNVRAISDTRYQAVRSSADLEKRIGKLERLIGFLTDMLLGLISACFAIAGVAFFDGGFHWEQALGAGLIALLTTLWLAKFIFPSAAG